MTIFTKICGISTIESAELLEELGTAYIGFVFFEKSPRNVTPKQAADICENLSRSLIKIAVMVNPDDSFIDNLLKDFTPDYFQLHGSESVQRVDDIALKYGVPIIKAISVSQTTDVKKAFSYRDVANIILFDAKPPKNSELPGGNGVSFDWKMLRAYSFDMPVFISGGIDINNVSQAVQESGVKMIDVSSGVESSAGVKDLIKIRQLLSKVAGIEA